jgi:hypothetical protein
VVGNERRFSRFPHMCAVTLAGRGQAGADEHGEVPDHRRGGRRARIDTQPSGGPSGTPGPRPDIEPQSRAVVLAERTGLGVAQRRVELVRRYLRRDLVAEGSPHTGVHRECGVTSDRSARGSHAPAPARDPETPPSLSAPTPVRSPGLGMRSPQPLCRSRRKLMLSGRCGQEGDMPLPYAVDIGSPPGQSRCACLSVRSANGALRNARASPRTATRNSNPPAPSDQYERFGFCSGADEDRTRRHISGRVG